MKKIILVGVCVLTLLVFPVLSLAQESISTNPFVPQLPKKPEPVVENVDQSRTDSYSMNLGRVEPSESSLREEKEINLPLLKISGLIWNTTRPQAIVNEKVVDVGDSVEDVKIVSIEKTGLEVEYMGKSFTVSP